MRGHEHGEATRARRAEGDEKDIRWETARHLRTSGRHRPRLAAPAQERREPRRNVNSRSNRRRASARPGSSGSWTGRPSAATKNRCAGVRAPGRARRGSERPNRPPSRQGTARRSREQGSGIGRSLVRSIYRPRNAPLCRLNGGFILAGQRRRHAQRFGRGLAIPQGTFPQPHDRSPLSPNRIELT